MSWSKALTGEFHEIVKSLRRFSIEGDSVAQELGHDKIAIEMALCAVDKAPSGSVFAITLSGHSSSKTDYVVMANVSASEKLPEG